MQYNISCKRSRIWFFITGKTPVTLGRRSHGDLDRHQIAVQNASIAVGSPWHRHETPWNRLERRGTAFVFCCKLQTPWDRRPLKNAVGTPCNRRDNAVQSPRTSWHRSESVVRSPWERQGGRKRLHSVYAAFMAIARRSHRDYTAFTGRSWRFQSDCITTPRRFQGDCTAFTRRSWRFQSDCTTTPRSFHGDCCFPIYIHR